MEVTHVQVFKDRVEIVNVALRKTHSLATARLPDHLRLSREVPAPDVAPVARTVPSLDPRPVNLGQQDMRQRGQNASGAPSTKSESRTTKRPSRMRIV